MVSGNPNLGIARRLVENGADVNGMDEDDHTPLHYCMEEQTENDNENVKRIGFINL